MKITISGLPGAGKTTAGIELARILECNFLSVGDLRGKFALEKNLTIDELNEKGKKDPRVDTDFDEFQKEFGKRKENMIIEGRLSYYFVPDSIKIFLYAEKKISAKRIFEDERLDEKKYNTLKETIISLEKRIQSDKERYWKNYKINPYDITQYDIILDTTEITKEQVPLKLLEKIKNYFKEEL